MSNTIFGNRGLMKVFEYTARDETGATRKDHISATDRAGAIFELRKRNLVLLSLVEAKGVLAVKDGKGIKINKMTLFSFFALLSIAAGILIVHLMSKPLKTQRMRTKEPSIDEKKNKGTSTSEATLESEKKLRHVVESQTNNVSTEPKKSRTPVDIAKEFDASRMTNNVPVFRPPPAFAMAIESLMHAVSRTPPGSPPIPLPPITRSIDESFIHSLTNNIVIYEDDSEKMAKYKEEAAYVKLELAKFVEAGYTAKQVLEAVQEERKEQYKLKKEIRKGMMELLQAGRIEDAKVYLSEANTILNERGIVPLSMPKELAEKPVQ
jgi:hypothetical protein